MPHLTCLDAEPGEIEEQLDHYKRRGIENIMALRGDPPQDTLRQAMPGADFCYARDLVRLIRKSYQGFCIGVAVYPEGHIETSSLEQDLRCAKEKIDAGADFAVTQMFFDNRHFYSLLDRMRGAGITIPVLPGILPLTSIDKVRQFASITRASVPRHIQEELERHRANPRHMEQAGIDLTIRQCKDLISQGYRRLHFFTLNRPQVMKAILDGITG